MIESPCTVNAIIGGMQTSDGAGVNLVRLIGTPRLDHLDPFLLLDAFRSDDPDDYIAGFPEHPHRGFETVTYLVAGKMQHGDSAGHSGVIEAGGVQWMTAGKGILHSEMPLQENGLLSGFQLWVNLPAAQKLMPPRYQEFGPDQIPLEQRDGVDVRVIAGRTHQGTTGPVQHLVTPVIYYDVAIAPHQRFEEAVPNDYNVLVHVFEGEVTIGTQRVRKDELAVLESGDAVVIEAGDNAARLLLLAGKPLNEPVARYGPFVMNSKEEIDQALRDYRDGRLIQ